MEFSVAQVAEMLGGEVVGEGSARLSSIGRIEDAGAGQLAFLSNPNKYGSFAYASEATALLVPDTFVPEGTVRAALIRVPNVQEATAQLLKMYASALPKPAPGIHASAVIEQGATIADDAHVGAFVYVGRNALIGARTILEPHSFIGSGVRTGEDCLLQTGARLLHDCSIGDRVRLLANAVVGADGFGHTRDATTGAWTRIPHLGNVVLEDDVEVGACATVDRAVMGSTVLKRGVKLDNLVMVAHNVSIDEHSAMAAQVGIAGSARIGKRVTMGGQVGTAGHITIADDVEIAAQSGIKDGIPTPAQKVFGSPAKPFRDWAKDQANIRNVDKLQARMSRLEKQLRDMQALLASREE